MNVLDGFIVGIPAAAAVASLVVPSRVSRSLTACAGLTTAACIIVAAIETSFHRGGHDALTALFLLPVAIVYGAVGLYTHWYVVAESPDDAAGERYRREFLALTNGFAFVEVIVPLVTNVPGMWVALEATTIVAALLVRLQGTAAALEAAWKYILIASCGLALGLVAVIVLYAAGARVLGTHYSPEWSSYIHLARQLNPDGVRLAFIFALIGFGTKMGLAPMHTWLPDAHGAGPTPTSAMLSGVVLSDAAYVILRFAAIADAALGPTVVQRMFIGVGLLSLFVAAFFLLQQSDIKRMLAYSSIEHMGVVAIGFGFGAPLAVAGALLHVVNHSASKSLAFFAAGRMAARYETREIAGIAGSVDALPISGTLFVAAALSLAGLPPFGIFRSELMILTAGFGSPFWIVAAFVLGLLVVAFAGITRWVTATTVGDAPMSIERGEHAVLPIVGMGLGFCVVLGLGIGVPLALQTLLADASKLIGTTP